MYMIKKLIFNNIYIEREKKRKKRLNSEEINKVYLLFWKFKLNFLKFKCRNPSFGFSTKAKGVEGCGPKGSLGVTSETPGSARECEGVSLHTPKATSTLGEGVPMDSQNFREPFEGSKLNGLWRSLYHWKALRT